MHNIIVILLYLLVHEFVNMHIYLSLGNSYSVKALDVILAISWWDHDKSEDTIGPFAGYTK